MVDTPQEPNLEGLLQWKLSLFERIGELKGAIRSAQVELNQVEERLALVTKLIDMDSRSEYQDAQSEPSHVIDTESNSPSPQAPELEDAVEELLRSAGQPLHISVIRNELIAKRIPIPGRGDEANIIVRLRKMTERFTRTARGTYGLPEWGIPEMPSKVRKTRKATRR